jgi:hypothetical protein
MKILILVLTYLDNNIYTKFYKKQNETWNSINYPGVETFFNINGGVKKEIDGHFIINNLPETIVNEGYKIINCFEKTLNWDYDYIFHTNSSSYVDKELLHEWLKDKPREKFYSGAIGEYRGYPFGSGCGFTISKDVVHLILNNQQYWEHGYADDATLGILLNNLGISVYKAPRFDIITDDVVEIPTDFFHYRCKTDNREQDILNMQKIYDLKNQKKINF